MTDPSDADPPALPPSREDGEPDAAHAALARARAAAVAKGLRPGSRPQRKRTFDGTSTAASRGSSGRSGSGPDRRDPGLLGDQLENLVADRGWQVDVAAGSVMGRWVQIVGDEVAQNAAPVTFEAGVLTVRAASTAWATQLRLLTSDLLARIEREVGAGQVTELRIVGPSAPSWRKGMRRSPDSRGPRDTYG